MARFIVAIDRGKIEALTQAFAADSALGALMLAGLLFAASVLQLALGLRPLTQLRKRLAYIRSGDATRLEGETPSEVEPLVGEVNADTVIIVANIGTLNL